MTNQKFELTSAAQKFLNNKHKLSQKQVFFRSCIEEYITKTEGSFCSVKALGFVLISAFVYSTNKNDQKRILEEGKSIQTSEEFYSFLVKNMTQPHLHCNLDVFYSNTHLALQYYFSICQIKYNKIESADEGRQRSGDIHSNVKNKNKFVSEYEQNKEKVLEAPVGQNVRNDKNQENLSGGNKGENYIPDVERDSTENKLELLKRTNRSIVYEIIDDFIDTLNTCGKDDNKELTSENIYTMMDCSSKIEGEDKYICLKPILGLFQNGIDCFNSLEVNQIISKGDIKRGNVRKTRNIILTHAKTFRIYNNFIQIISEFLENIKTKADYMKSRIINLQYGNLYERIKNLQNKIKNIETTWGWIECTVKLRTAMERNRQGRIFSSYKFLDSCHKTHVIAEYMDEILFLLYDIRRIGMALELFKEEKTTTSIYSDEKVKESFKMVLKTFETNIFPVLLNYSRKGNGKICKIDIENIVYLFKRILGTLESSELYVYQNSFANALYSFIDIVKSAELKKLINQKSAISKLSEIFIIIENNMMKPQTTKTTRETNVLVGTRK